MRPLNVADYRELARRRLPRGLFEFVDRGTEDERALSNNRRAWEALSFVPRTLVDVSARSAGINLFGKPWTFPVAIAPTGAAGLMSHDGEVALARAAARAGVPFTVATGSLTSLERVAQEAGGTLWFQLYMWPEREASLSLVARAQAAGYEALVVTVDTAVPSNREYNLRSGFTIPFRFTARNALDVMSHPRWLMSVIGRYMATTGLPRYENYPPQMRARVTAAPVGRAMKKTDSLTWADLKALRAAWPRTLLVKGVLSPHDAQAALECGADGLIVSNHGGRMLDASIAPADALPAIVQAVGGRIPILVDGHIQRGSDVVKALCLGASAVLVGRATLWGVAVNAEAGAADVLRLLHEETVRVMGLIGQPSTSDLGLHCLAAVPRTHPASTATHA
jgi:isopentenyl diphosphate isomerase/L-lactate dehydrogenase-like FMN-dependent dehydrogenase